MFVDNVLLQQQFPILPLSKCQLFEQFRVELQVGGVKCCTDTQDLVARNQVFQQTSNQICLPISVCDPNINSIIISPFQINVCLKLFQKCCCDAPILFILDVKNTHDYLMNANSNLLMRYVFDELALTAKQIEIIDYLFFVDRIINSRSMLVEKYAKSQSDS